MELKTALSASRIKTAKTCSWQYFCNYILKLPEKSNDGASKGWICHLVFECLGIEKRLQRWKDILESGDIFSDTSIKRLVYKHARILGVDDDESIESIKEMTLKGLKFDFQGTELGAPDRIEVEFKFDLEVIERGKKYRVKGFIDRMFFYDDKKIIIIRDFKSSKRTFEGDDLNKNYQDYMYCLVVRKLWPGYNFRQSQFVFLQFDLSNGSNSEGCINMDVISEEDLDAFEDHLTQVQVYLDDFDENAAKGDYAANKPFGKGFTGPIVCGLKTKYPGEKKANGENKWHCPYKFAFGYYVVLDESDKIVKSDFLGNYLAIKQNLKVGQRIERRNYQGCPRFNGDIFDKEQKQKHKNW